MLQKKIRNSVFLRIPQNTEVCIPSIQNFYGIPPEFRIPYSEFGQKKFRRNFFDGIMHALRLADGQSH